MNGIGIRYPNDPRRAGKEFPGSCLAVELEDEIGLGGNNGLDFPMAGDHPQLAQIEKLLDR